MVNQGWDVPFGGDFGRDDAGPDDLFPESQTDRIMAFDVVVPYDVNVPDYTVQLTSPIAAYLAQPRVARWHCSKVGTVWSAAAAAGHIRGRKMGGYTLAFTDHRNPTVDTNEIQEIYNVTGNAHPVHLHLVNFQILGRAEISFDEDGLQRVVQHNGKWGWVTTPENILIGNRLTFGPGDGYYGTAPEDIVTALPETVTTIELTSTKRAVTSGTAIFLDKDHEMMRVLQVG